MDFEVPYPFEFSDVVDSMRGAKSQVKYYERKFRELLEAETNLEAVQVKENQNV
jgi:hypothetical protein